DHNNVCTNSEELKKEKIRIYKKYVDKDQIDMNNLLKICLIVNGQSQERIDELIENYTNEFKDLHIIESRTSYSVGIDITSGKANKHLAILKLCEILNIDPSI